jgi:hypothetical protein
VSAHNPELITSSLSSSYSCLLFCQQAGPKKQHRNEFPSNLFLIPNGRNGWYARNGLARLEKKGPQREKDSGREALGGRAHWIAYDWHRVEARRRDSRGLDCSKEKDRDEAK